MSGASLDQRIARRAARSNGVFSRATALELGATRATIQRRLETGRWVAPFRGVSVLAGSQPTWEQRLLAACMACRGVASHLAGARLLSIPGPLSDDLELSVAEGRRPRVRGVIIHQVPLSRADLARVRGVPLTTPGRTLIDLAGSMTAEALEIALDDVVTRELTTFDALARRSAAAGPRSGIGALRAMVQARTEHQTPAQSPLETRVHRLIRSAGLPAPQRQFDVTDGSRRAFLDFAWPDRKVALEADGYRFHAGRERWESDRTRLTMLTLLGWRVLHVTARDLDHPGRVTERVRRALG